jgi:Resolvase, N terminal domain
MANLMLSLMGAFAEFERSLIKERQKERVALAKQRGANKGRKKTLTPERAAELVQRAGTGGTESPPCPRLRDQQGDGLPVPAPSQAGMKHSPAGTTVAP